MIDVNQIISVLASITAGAFGIIITMIGWNWSKLHNKVDELVSTLQKIASDIHGELSNHEVRITVLEEHHKNCKK